MKLPIKNKRSFFEIRLEAIGGLGANLAGQILAEAAVLGAGLNGVNFSSYGSEKKGTPVKSFIRLADADTPIYDHSPVENPHVIAIFHESLYKTIPITKGLLPDGIVLVNTTKNADEVRVLLNLKHGRIATVDAFGIALDEKTRINTAMIGALCRLLTFIDPDHVKHVIVNTFREKYPELLEANLKTFARGYEEVAIEPAQVNSFAQEGEKFAPEKIRMGYATMPPGGIVTLPANSMEKDVSISRTGYLPAFDIKKCIHCAKCDLVCPDHCFVWEEKEGKRGQPLMFLKGIDYQYCKGCLKCVEVCPADALAPVRETDDYAETHNVQQESPVLKEEVL